MSPDEFKEKLNRKVNGRTYAQAQANSTDPRRLPECPLCGNDRNDADLGGTELCFHCPCGFLQCGDG